MKGFNRATIIWVVLIAAVYLGINFAIAGGVITAFHEITLVTIMLNMMLALSLNLVIGFAGQFSLGHAGFMAIGAYSGAIISKQMPGLTGLLLGMLVGVLLAGAVAVVIGVPTLRLSGDYLAIATLGASEIIRILILVFDDVTNGPAGISGIPEEATWFVVFFFLVITTVLLLNYVRSSSGRATIAIRENEIAAEAMGVHSLRYKVIAFVLGAMVASVAGTLYAGYFATISPQDFTFQNSIDVLIIVVFGGIGSMTDSGLAAVFLGLLNMALQQFGQVRLIIYAALLILVMIFKPSGLLGNKELTISGLLARVSQGKKGVAP